MKEWKRLIPHPYYGNYGGRGNNQDGKEPIDELDWCFMMHDIELWFAKDNLERLQADLRLTLRVRNIRIGEIKSTYGRIYAAAVLKLFGG